MTREEAILEIDYILFEQDYLKRKEIMKALKQPVTLADFLGWEEGQEYEWRGDKYRIFYDILQYFDEDERVWWDSIEELNDYLRLRQAKKVEEPKLKGWHVRDEYRPSDRYIIEYHKVEPRYLLQTDLTSENGIQYLSFDKERRKYFLGALMANKNVQQAFTDDEISKMNAITRFAKLCKKIKVE